MDREFGTGAVKITPAHDQDDYATGKRHGLPAPTILADDATDREHRHGVRRPGPIRGASTDRRPTSPIVAISSGERPHEMIIGRCQRSDDVLEPRLKTQWFIRTEPLAARALDATRSGRTRILPERFEKTWEHWLTDIRDWNVSAASCGGVIASRPGTARTGTSRSRRRRTALRPARCADARPPS